VANAAGLLVLLVVLLDLGVFDDLTVLFDMVFVLICVGAALAVRPRDFFVIGVYPPLLMAVTVAVLAVLARETVADPADGFLQAVVSGLAHHSGYLVVGYALTLAILAIRQTVIRNAGTLRSRPRVPRQRGAQQPTHQTAVQPNSRQTVQHEGPARAAR